MATDAEKLKFRASLEAGVDKYVKQQGRNTIALNAENDPACAGYQRVAGPDACDFCVTMSASNGFYSSEKSAGGGSGHGTAEDAYHPYCNCSIVLVFGKKGRLVARDLETGEVTPYDGRKFVERYNEIGRPTYDKKAGVVYRDEKVAAYKDRVKELGKSIRKAKSGLAKKDPYIWDANMDELLGENGFRQDLIHIQHNADFSANELMLAGRFADEGHDVEILHASSLPASHTPDFRIDGVPMEAKQLEVTSTARLGKKIWQASAQSRDVIADLSLETISRDEAIEKAKEMLATPKARYLSDYELSHGYSRGVPEIRVDSVTLVFSDSITTVARK